MAQERDQTRRRLAHIKATFLGLSVALTGGIALLAANTIPGRASQTTPATQPTTDPNDPNGALIGPQQVPQSLPDGGGGAVFRSGGS